MYIVPSVTTNYNQQEPKKPEGLSCQIPYVGNKFGIQS